MIWPTPLLVLCLLATTVSASSNKVAQTGMAPAVEAFAKLPFLLEPNRGQGDANAVFIGRGSGYTLNLRRDGVQLNFERSQHGTKNSDLHIKFRGSSIPDIEPKERAATRSNYYLGARPDQWIVDLPTYHRVRYRRLYPGIDAEFYGHRRGLEYDFVVAPRADAGKIRLQFAGAENIRLGKGGALVLQTAAGELTQLKPVAYQSINGIRRQVEARYVLHRDSSVSLALGKYDRGRELIIDPIIVFGSYETYVKEPVFAMDVSAGGSVFLTGFTRSQANHNVFVLKLNTSGTAATYQTFFGGASEDVGRDLVVDSSGNAYVAGTTRSSDFPTTAGAFDRSRSGFDDGFITKLNASGKLAYSTLVGGSGGESIYAIAIDSSRNIYATGVTNSSNYPTTSGAYDRTLNDTQDLFVTKLNSSGSALGYSTYLGSTGGGNDWGFGIAVDSSGQAYVVGQTGANFPTTVGSFQPLFGGTQDAFVTKFNAGGSDLIYSTYLGGTGVETANAVAVDDLGAAYVTGHGGSANFPRTPGAYTDGGNDTFLTKLHHSGSAAEYSLAWGFGGSAPQSTQGIAVDAAGSAYVSGSNGPAFIAKFNPSGSDREFQHPIGGSDGKSVAIDGNGRVYVAGFAFGHPLETTPFAYRQTGEGFAFKLAPVCTLSEGPETKICTPADGITVASPLRLVGGASSPNSVGLYQIYIDRVKAFEIGGVDSLDMQIPMKPGMRRFTLQTKDRAGITTKHTINVNISGGCTLSTADPAVTICLPKNNSTVGQGARLVASANSSRGVKLLQVYVNGRKLADMQASILDTFVPLAKGNNRITIQARDAAGRVFKSTVFVTAQ